MDIKKKIKEHGWTLERLAAEMKGKDGTKGVTQPAMSNIVNGNPTLDKLQEIANVIGISVAELLADENEHTHTCKCPYCGQNLKIAIHG